MKGRELRDLIGREMAACGVPCYACVPDEDNEFPEGVACVALSQESGVWLIVEPGECREIEEDIATERHLVYSGYRLSITEWAWERGMWLEQSARVLGEKLYPSDMLTKVARGLIAMYVEEQLAHGRWDELDIKAITSERVQEVPVNGQPEEGAP
jgi:hypothetical protein